jgi:hypothetical protein
MRDTCPEALPASLLSEIATQLPIIFRENDSLDDFLDRMLLRAYEQLRKQTGSHSKAAASSALTEFHFTNGLSAHGSGSSAASHREKWTID